MTSSSTSTGTFVPTEMNDVGGVRLPRPFHLSRIGHVGINVKDVRKSLSFYRDLLGFRQSDTLDVSWLLPPEKRPSDESATAVFMHHASDHHSFALFPPAAAEGVAAVMGEFPMEVTTNQISWQCGGLAQVVHGNAWMRSHARRIAYSGRDIPGSNFHFYTPDEDGHLNEVFYGMEQIGWSGRSKPEGVRDLIGFMEPPSLPYISESAELEKISAAGIDLNSGYAELERLPETFEVEGVMLARPFRIGKIGPVRLFVKDVEASLPFYRDLLGLTITEEVEWEGHRCVFLRCTTEHHSLGLYPIALRERLELSDHSTMMSIGMQVRSYRQLTDAIDFLRGKGVTIRYLPQELFPGIDYSAFAIDPCGHAIQLYFQMEQIGWDGKPRPAELRHKAIPGEWPDQIDPQSDTYCGEPFLGPLG